MSRAAYRSPLLVLHFGRTPCMIYAIIYGMICDMMYMIYDMMYGTIYEMIVIWYDP